MTTTIQSRKVYFVGDEQFSTYCDAQGRLRGIGESRLRSDLIEIINSFYASNGIADIRLADALLATYEIKPRKTRNE